MAELAVYTFQDAVDHLLDHSELIQRSGLNTRACRRAVLTALRDLANHHSWSIYRQRYVLQTVASQSSSTITYDHTGGAYERMVTIAAGTWPSWAAFGRISIDGVTYDIAERKSSTVITLTPNSNPGQDVAAGTSYSIFRSRYPLPVDFRRLVKIYDVADNREIPVATDVVHQHRSVTVYDTVGTPWTCSIYADGEYYGSTSVNFLPPPDSIRSYDILYERAPRALKIEKYSTGTVSVSSGSTAVTLSGGTLPVDCVGSIIRFSADGTTEPTGVSGSFSSTGALVDNPYFAQRSILSRDSSTTCTIDSAASDSTSLSAVKYTISDPLDLEPNAMLTAFLKAAEAELFRYTGKKDANEKQAVARQAILEAMEADLRAPYSGPMLPYDYIRHASIDNVY